MQAEHETILAAAAEYLFSDNFSQASDQLARQHAHLFVGATGIDGEQRLEWQEVYTQYRAVYERVLTDFLQRQNVSLESFCAACEDALSNSEWQHLKGFVEVVLAMESY
eukprot:1214307-Prymnesium_polylepis.1